MNTNPWLNLGGILKEAYDSEWGYYMCDDGLIWTEAYPDSLVTDVFV